MIGKRKRETAVASRSHEASPSPTPPADNTQDIFRKYFEAQFEPLDLPASRPTENSDSEEEFDDDSEDLELDEESEEGPEDDGEDGKVEVVEYKDARIAPDTEFDKMARKAFMVRIIPLS